jgi:hypothetical protein
MFEIAAVSGKYTKSSEPRGSYSTVPNDSPTWSQKGWTSLNSALGRADKKPRVGRIIYALQTRGRFRENARDVARRLNGKSGSCISAPIVRALGRSIFDRRNETVDQQHTFKPSKSRDTLASRVAVVAA